MPGSHRYAGAALGARMLWVTASGRLSRMSTAEHECVPVRVRVRAFCTKQQPSVMTFPEWCFEPRATRPCFLYFHKLISSRVTDSGCNTDHLFFFWSPCCFLKHRITLCLRQLAAHPSLIMISLFLKVTPENKIIIIIKSDLREVHGFVLVFLCPLHTPCLSCDHWREGGLHFCAMCVMMSKRA